MNGDLNDRLTEFFEAKLENTGVAWLVAFAKKSKAEQKTEFLAFVQADNVQTDAQIGSESTVSSAKLARLEARKAANNTIISTF